MIQILGKWPHYLIINKSPKGIVFGTYAIQDVELAWYVNGKFKVHKERFKFPEDHKYLQLFRFACIGRSIKCLKNVS